MMDDFSFPTVAVDEDPLASFPHFASSPFWFLSSASSGRSTDVVSTTRPRSSPSAGDQQLSEGAEAMEMNPKADSDESSRRFVDEERMDMLWEDFNDETARKLSKIKASSDSAGNSCRRRRRSCEPEQQCGSLIHRRRPSLIVMVKVLKKLLFIQKAAAASYKRKHHHSLDSLQLANQRTNQ